MSSMDSTMPMPLPPTGWEDSVLLPREEALDAVEGAPTVAHALRFTGDGGVYFGVWMVNILLCLVTLGLYTPFARRRTLQYFYAHTSVAGSPLEFTGAIRRMFFGFLLFFGWYVSYEIAGYTEQAVATGLLGLLWSILLPWLWASAVRFRTTSTRWRGLPGNFRISGADAYRAFLPSLVIVAMVVPFWMMEAPLPRWFGWYLLLFLVVGLAVTVWLDHSLTSARLRHTAFAGQGNRWTPDLRDFARFSAVAFGLFLLALAMAGVAMFIVVLGLSRLPIAATIESMLRLGGAVPRDVGKAISFVLGFVATFFTLYLALGPAVAYRQARKFALVWNNVRLGTVAHFTCNLRARDLVELRIRNLFLNIVTGGFWRPFAVTSEYRLKLESVTLHVRGDLDELVGRFEQQQGALGDAVADVVGFDVVG